MLIHTHTCLKRKGESKLVTDFVYFLKKTIRKKYKYSENLERVGKESEKNG